MREIGSEFWDVPISEKKNGLFPDQTRWFLSGRHALRAIIHQLQDVKSIAMPSWCCDSMVIPFLDKGIEVHFYPVFFSEKLIQRIILECDALFLIDYFGYTAVQPNLSNYKGVVIRDITHSIFTNKYEDADADYYFGSLRKWCGIPTGGFAWGYGLEQPTWTDLKYIALRRQAMKEKESFIAGGEVGEKSFISVFEKAENRLEEHSIYSSVDADVDEAVHLDIDYIRVKRQQNASLLMEAFRDWLIFKDLKKEDCPMFVPVRVPDGRRDELRRFLINHSIYCPIHWPLSSYHKLVDIEKDIYLDELSLVCDHRYTVDDMGRIIKTIKSFMPEA